LGRNGRSDLAGSQLASGQGLILSIFDKDPNDSVFNRKTPVNAPDTATDRIRAMAGLGLGKNIQDVAYRSGEGFSTEQAVREEAAVALKLDRRKALASVIGESVETEPEVAAAAVELGGVSPAAITALEERYVGAMQDIPATYPDFNERRFADVPTQVRRENTAVNLELVQSRIDRIQQSRNVRNPINIVGEFAMLMTPFAFSMAETGAVGEQASLWENVFSGQRQRQESREFNRALMLMSPEEFGPYVEQLDSRLREAATVGSVYNQVFHQQLWEGLLDSTPAAVTDTFNAIDVLAVGGSGLRAVRSAPRAVRAAGSREASADLTAMDVVRRETTGASMIPEEDLVDAVSVAAVRTTPDLGVGVPVRVADKLDELRANYDPMPTRRLNEAEEAQAVAASRSRIESQVGRPLVDFHYEQTRLADGTQVPTVVASIGRVDGTGFQSSDAARRGAVNMGLRAEDVVQDTSGQWFVRHRANVDESAFYVTTLPESSSSFMTRFFASGRLSAGEDISRAATVSEMNRNQFIRNIVQPTERAIRRLNDGERRQLGQVFLRGQIERQWYDRAAFDRHFMSNTGKRPSNRVWEAYESARDLNDMEYVLRNDALYRDKGTRGFQTISFDVGDAVADRMNGRVLTTVDGPTRAYVPGARGLQVIDDIPEGHVLVRLESPFETSTGWTTDTILLKRSQVAAEALRRDQLAYSPGGHRMYPAEHFVRQARVGSQPDGSQFLTSPRTFIGTRTSGQARFWADRMNEANRLAVEAGDAVSDPAFIRQLDELFEGHPSLPSGKEYSQMVQRGQIDTSRPFEVLRDRELPTDYRRADPSRQNFAGDDATSAFEEWLGGQGRMYYSTKGDDVLPDFEGRQGQLLDFSETLQRSLSNIANLSATGDFRSEFIARWARTYGKHTDMPSDASPNEIFFGARITSRDERVISAAEAQRAAIMNAMGQQTPAAQAFRARTAQLIDSVAGQDPNSWFGKFRNSAASQMQDWHRTENVQAAFTGAAFDLKLGLFNIAQVPLQLSHAYAILNLAPWTGGRLLMNTGPSAAFLFNGNPRMLDHMINVGMHKAIGLNADEYRSMMTAFRQSGFPFPGNAHIMINNTGTSPLAFQGIREWGRMPFNFGEGFPRIMAYQVGWMETRRKFPELAMDSPEFMRRAMGRADDYAFNMTRATSAPWQRGVSAIPTQFFSYFSRMLEAMTSDKFTRAQRAQLLAGQAAGYGIAGVPFANLVGQAYEAAMGVETDRASIDSIRGAAERGLFDRLWYEMTGQDVTISTRIGAGSFFGDFVNTLFGNSPYGEVSFADVAGGASYNIWLDTFGSTAEVVGETVQYLAAIAGDEEVPLPRRAYLRALANMSTANNAIKAYAVYRHGQYRSAAGRLLVDDLPNEQAIATLLSFPPAEMQEVGHIFRYKEQRDEVVNDLTNRVQTLINEAINDPASGPDRYAEIAVLMRLSSPDVAARVQRNVARERGESVLTIMRRYRDIAEAERRIAEEVNQ